MTIKGVLAENSPDRVICISRPRFVVAPASIPIGFSVGELARTVEEIARRGLPENGVRGEAYHLKL